MRVIDAGVVPYGEAYEWQRTLHASRVSGDISDLILLLEHPHVYSLGRKFKKEHLLVGEEFLKQRKIELFEADRGGSITYHGPGQIVGYPILDLRRTDQPEFQPDPIRYLRMLEETIVRTLKHLGIVSRRREGMTGVWVGDSKVASIGVNVSRGVTKHGFALNVDTDLSYFEGMVPCGLERVQMTSVSQLSGSGDIQSIKALLATSLATIFHRRLVRGNLSDIEEIVDPKSSAKIRSQADVIPFPKTSSG